MRAVLTKTDEWSGSSLVRERQDFQAGIYAG